jgi:hypothetical protein
MLLGFLGFIPLVYLYNHLLKLEQEARDELGCDSGSPIYFSSDDSHPSAGQLSLQRSGGELSE